jgi:small-conductance mechanosensitive channel
MRAVERWVSWVAWIAVAMWITGVLPLLLTELDAIQWKIGSTRMSVRNLLEGTVTAVAVLVVALWVSAALEARLLQGATDNLSVRKMAANALRAVLLLVGLMFALSAAGIDLTALGVLGGALGVGIGLGLQKLAANYVSGFVILAERSMRIGDIVKVDGFEGRISDITTRYTVIRALNGREAIVPNEMMITQRVENCSLADPKVALTTVLQVAYGTDLDTLMPQLVAVVAQVPRVLADPGPGVQLSAFAADGLELTLAFWINDAENGTGNVRSDVNRAVLRELNRPAVEIPFPQRVVRRPAGERRWRSRTPCRLTGLGQPARLRGPLRPPPGSSRCAPATPSGRCRARWCLASRRPPSPACPDGRTRRSLPCPGRQRPAPWALDGLGHQVGGAAHGHQVGRSCACGWPRWRPGRVRPCRPC